ncbi:MAG: hypothetical protein JWO06_1019 [Bacteroidota bacterium]|nr:hypothetical protein [Bacteroidota bacterium]
MKYSLLLILVFASYLGHAQQEVVFTVSPSTKITLEPNIDTLLSDKEYQFTVRGMPLKNIVRFYFAGGKATLKDSTLTLQTTAYFKPRKKVFLKAIVQVNAEPKEITAKNFVVIPDPDKIKALRMMDKPLMSVYWWNPNRPLSSHNTIPKGVLLRPESNTLSIENPTFPSKRYAIFSYTMVFNNNDSIKTLTVKNNRLSSEVVEAITGLKGKSVIKLSMKYFCANERADELTEGPFYIHIKD